MSAQRPTRLRWLVIVLMALATLLAGYAVTTRLHLDPNVAALLPRRGEAAALRRYLRAFGGSDLTLVLVRGRSGATPGAVASAARAVRDGLAARDTVEVAADGLDLGEVDPLLAWRHAGAAAREQLELALTPDGMRRRLRASRAMLLAPGAGEAAERIARDPLRLLQLLRDERIGAGFETQADGSFATGDGLARLVLVFPKGQALRGADAKAFTRDARQVIAAAAAEHPAVTIGLAGGHAIAEATERMLVGDLTRSGTLSLLLAALLFALTFRRLRALWAVMPPLVLGTLWTAGIAAGLPGGLSAIAVAFMSVVVGVGVDTGVHVYAALLQARADGLHPDEAARVARRRTARPVLVAALTAAVAFGSLALSEIAALRQLGVLCAGGEILTALAIVAITPWLGARLERGEPYRRPPPRWTRAVAALTASRPRALALVVLTLAPVVWVVAGARPRLADAIVAMRPKGIEPLQVQEQIYQAFGGRSGQWVVLLADRSLERARERADAVAEALGAMPNHVESLDALTALVPADATQRARLAARDRLDLPAKARELERALVEIGFAPARFEGVLSAMRRAPVGTIGLDALNGKAGVMRSRYLGRDGDDAMVALYVLPRPGSEAAVERAVRAADATAMVTGYGRLEGSLRATLASDLPRIGLVAGALVLLALIVALRDPRDVLLAVAVVAAEIAIVLLAIRLFDVPLHAYDALVLPVLLGITVDEGMFLLYRAREVGGEVERTLMDEGPPVATTALTTAAGFGALVGCQFDGLRHLGMVGAIGSITGLVAALVIIPAGLRLWPRRRRATGESP